VTEFNPLAKAADEVRKVLQWLAARLSRLHTIEIAEEGAAIPLRAVS